MPNHEDSRSRFLPRRPAAMVLVAAALLALGGATGAVVTAAARPSVSMAPVTPVTIRSLSSTGIVTIRGQVAEVYGNKFVMEDGTGRALVDSGPEGDRRILVTPGSLVAVQDRFERGFVHAAFLVGPNAKVLALGPLTAAPDGPHNGSDRSPSAPPSPPPGTGGKAPPPPLIAATSAPAVSPPRASPQAQ